MPIRPLPGEGGGAVAVASGGAPPGLSSAAAKPASGLKGLLDKIFGGGNPTVDPARATPYPQSQNQPGT